MSRNETSTTCAPWLVVATDKKAFAKVERELAATGLLGLTRVALALADG